MTGANGGRGCPPSATAALPWEGPAGGLHSPSPPPGLGRPDRQRDLLPLPLPPASDLEQDRLDALGHGTKRRLQRRHHRDSLLREAVVALNGMYTGVDGALCCGPAEATAAQRRCTARLRGAVDRMGPPPPGLTSADALQELQLVSAYDPEASGTRVGLVVDHVSLPAVGSNPLPLAQLLGVAEEEWTRRFVDGKVCWPTMKHGSAERRRAS